MAHACLLQDLGKGPAFTIAAKPPGAAPERSSMPGPGEYDARNPAVGRGAAYTIGQRLDGDKGHAAATPGPAEYAVPPVGKGAAFTMAGRTGGGMLDGGCAAAFLLHRGCVLYTG